MNTKANLNNKSESSFMPGDNILQDYSKIILPIHVSDDNLNRAYRILDALIYAFDEMEGYTRVSLESGMDRAYFAVMRTAFYFEMKEENRKKRKSSDEEMPPLLVLSLRSAESYACSCNGWTGCQIDNGHGYYH